MEKSIGARANDVMGYGYLNENTKAILLVKATLPYSNPLEVIQMLDDNILMTDFLVGTFFIGFICHVMQWLASNNVTFGMSLIFWMFELR
jgi:hypothetical protein